jgi:outer membrane protein assembly factor BamB
MKRRTWILVAMWTAALSVMGVILYAQSQSPPPPDPAEARRAQLFRPEDRAPSAKRSKLPVRPVEKGQPRMFRGDRRHTGRSTVRGPAAAELAWRFETRERITGQAVVAGDGRIYVGSHDHHLYAIHPHGTLAWRRDLGDRIYATPLVDRRGNVYVGSDFDLFCSYTREGEERWRIATEGDADTGAVEAPDGTIHFGAGNDLWAVRPDGTVKWRFRANSKIYATPAVDDDGTVYVGSQDDRFYAVASDGRMRWSYRTRADNDGSPAIGDDGTIYFGSDDKRVYAVTRDGALRWATDVDGYVRGAIGLGIDGSVLAGVFGPRPRVIKLDAATGDPIWAFPVTVADSAEVGISSGPLVDADGTIFIGAHDDFLYALAPGGDLRWIFETEGDVDSAPVLGDDGTLYFGSDDGRLYALRAPPPPPPTAPEPPVPTPQPPETP